MTEPAPSPTPLWPGADSAKRAQRKRERALEPGTPAAQATRRAVTVAVKGVVRALHELEDSGKPDPAQVHQLRVGTRRVEAALAAFEPWLKAGPSRGLRKRLKGLRRAAATARRCDVQIGMLRELGAGAAEAERALLDAIVGTLKKERRLARFSIAAEAHDRLEAVERWGRRARRGVRRSDAQRPLADVASERLPLLADAMASFRAHPEPSTHELHALRIAGKRARYALELMSSCLPEEEFRGLYARMEQFQERLGAFNDACELLETLEGWSGRTLQLKADMPEGSDPETALASAISRVRQRAASHRRSFLDWWFSRDADAMLAAFRAPVVRPTAEPTIAEAKPDVLARIDASSRDATDAGPQGRAAT